MFWIVCDPSSESIEMYLTKITRSGSQMFVVCLVGVWQCKRCQTPTKHTTNICEPLRVILVFSLLNFYTM